MKREDFTCERRDWSDADAIAVHMPMDMTYMLSEADARKLMEALARALQGEGGRDLDAGNFDSPMEVEIVWLENKVGHHEREAGTDRSYSRGRRVPSADELRRKPPPTCTHGHVGMCPLCEGRKP